MAIGLLVVQLIGTRFGILGSCAFVIDLLALSSPLFLKVEDISDIFKRINNFFVLFVLLSIFFHLLMKTSLLPDLDYVDRGDYSYQNYLVYLYSPTYEERFCGFCYEPGFFSILLSALLLVNKYDFKKVSTYIYLIALLLTLSLGGYIITIVCSYLYYIFNKVHNISRFILKNVFIFASLFLIVTIVTTYWNDGDNVVRDKILDRMEYDESKGVAGNNRQNIEALLLWEEFLQSDSKLFGYGDNRYKELIPNNYDAASIAEFIMRCGFVGAFIQILSIAFFCFYKKKKKYSVPVFVFLMLDFIQHGYGVEISMYTLLFTWLVYSDNNENYENVSLEEKPF